MINKDMIGEYIYLTNKSYPCKAYFYKDKNIVKILEIKSIQEFTKVLSDKMKTQNCQFFDFIINNSCVTEVIIDNKGIVKFSIGVNNE